MALLCIKYNIKADIPPALYDLVQPASAVHNYKTRYATNQNLYIPFSRSNYGLARLSVVASQTWEAIAMKITCLPLDGVKKEYKLSQLSQSFITNFYKHYITSTHMSPLCGSSQLESLAPLAATQFILCYV